MATFHKVETSTTGMNLLGVIYLKKKNGVKNYRKEEEKQLSGCQTPHFKEQSEKGLMDSLYSGTGIQWEELYCHNFIVSRAN